MKSLLFYFCNIKYVIIYLNFQCIWNFHLLPSRQILLKSYVVMKRVLYYVSLEWRIKIKSYSQLSQFFTGRFYKIRINYINCKISSSETLTKFTNKLNSYIYCCVVQFTTMLTRWLWGEYLFQDDAGNMYTLKTIVLRWE